MMQIQSFDKLKSEIAIKIAPSLSIVVKDDDSMNKALLAGKEVKHFAKLIEDKRKELVKPLNDQVDEINAYAKSLKEMPLQAEIHLKYQLASWENKKRAEREAEQKRLDEEAKKRQQELEAKQKEDRERMALAAEFGYDDEADLKRQEIIAKADQEREQAQLDKDIKSESKAIESNKVSGARTVWKFEVTDANLVPREFLIVDETKIRKAMNAGLRELPGVRFYEDTQIALR